MKTIEALSAFQAVQNLINDPAPKSPHLSYALVRNRRILGPIVEQYNEKIMAQQDPKLDELLAEWRKLAPNYAKTQDGEIVHDENGGVIIAPEKLMDYNLACEKVMTDTPDFKAAFDVRSELIGRLQNEDVTADVYPIKVADLPGTVGVDTMELLWPLIEA